MRVHFFSKENFICAYFPDSLRYFRVNERTKGIITDVVNNLTRDAILSYHRISSHELDKIAACIPKDEQQLFSSLPYDICRRLVLHITNDCNLACKYCYANGGVYLAEHTVMSLEILLKALDCFVSHFRDISTIQLFGGEPCLNLAAVETVGHYIEKLPADERPILGMVTNGTLLTEEAIAMICRYNIHVTLSLDGPNEINNRLRVFSNGRGSSDIVENNLRQLQIKAKTPIAIESTYTKLHDEENISISEIIRYYNDKFGIRNIHIAPAMGALSPDIARLLKADVSQIFANAASLYPLPTMIIKILRILKSKKSICQLCDAGLGTYAVSADGSVYPCFILTDQADMRIGNVKDESLFDSDTFLRIKKQAASFNKLKEAACKDCFANTVCSGCIGRNYFENGNITVPAKEHCRFMQTLLEETLLALIQQPSTSA